MIQAEEAPDANGRNELRLEPDSVARTGLCAVAAGSGALVLRQFRSSAVLRC